MHLSKGIGEHGVVHWGHIIICTKWYSVPCSTWWPYLFDVGLFGFNIFCLLLLMFSLLFVFLVSLHCILFDVLFDTSYFVIILLAFKVEFDISTWSIWVCLWRLASSSDMLMLVYHNGCLDSSNWGFTANNNGIWLIPYYSSVALSAHSQLTSQSDSWWSFMLWSQHLQKCVL